VIRSARAPLGASAALAAVLCAMGFGCAGAASSGGAGAGRPAGEGPPVRSRADLWITIGDFRHVTTVAASDRVVYFGSSAGLERWDPLREAWLAPLTSADDLPDDRITALAVDRFGTDAWIGTRRGLVRIAFDDVVEPVWGPPPATVEMLLLDPRDGTVHALVGSWWWRGRGASFEREAGPPPGPLERAMRVEDLDPAEVPWLDPLYVRSPLSFDLVRLTEVDRDASGDWYAGTWGDNGRRWRSVQSEWEPLYFGLAGRGGGPVVEAADGLWFLPGGDSERDAALAHASRGLEAWSYVAPRLQPTLPSAIWRAGIAIGDTLFLAGDLGFAWGVGPEWRSAGAEDVGRASALAADGPILWIGTERGLVAWDRVAGSPPAPALGPRRVNAIAVASDAIFVGSDAGLWAASRAGPPGSVADAAAIAEALVPVEPRGRSVRALALLGALLLVASERGLEVFDRASGEWRVFATSEGAIEGSALAVASDGENAWVGTERGLTRWRPQTGEWRAYGQADGLAGTPVLHILAQRDAIWASTPGGVTRFAWREAEL
jgi:hypothetical protein